MAKKRVMILGAGQLQVPLLEKAKERDYEIIIVSPDSNQPGIKYADYFVQLDVKDEHNILKAAIEYNINGITTDQTDLPVRTAAYVADMMGLPSIGYEIGCLFTDKYKQRIRSKKIGVPTPRFAVTYSIEEAIVKSRQVLFPAIIKPVDSQASHGVSRVDSIEDLKKKYKDAVAYSRNGGVLLEQWIDGIEFPVDSYVINGKCTTMAIGQYHPFLLKDVFSSYETVWPAEQPKSVLNLIDLTNRKIVEGFGLKTGRTHGEFIVSDGQCYLVEIGARGGGSFFSSDDVRYVTGVSTEDFLLDFAMGEEVKVTYSEERHKCCSTLFFYLPENGVVKSVRGLSQVLHMSYIRRNNLDNIYLGMKTRPIIDKGSRFFVVVVADNYRQLTDRINNIRESLKIVTLCNNMQEKLPIWK